MTLAAPFTFSLRHLTGLLLCAGVAAMLWSGFDIGSLELGTRMMIDVGVFLVVLGALNLLLGRFLEEATQDGDDCPMRGYPVEAAPTHREKVWHQRSDVDGS